MPIRVDAYTNTGMASGWLLEAPISGKRSSAAATRAERVSRGRRWRTSRRPRSARSRSNPTTSSSSVGDDESIVPVHAVWHSVGLEAGDLPHRGSFPRCRVQSRARPYAADRRVRAAPRRPRRDQGPTRRRGSHRPPRFRQPLHRRAGRGRSHAGVLLPRRGRGHLAPAGTAGWRDNTEPEPSGGHGRPGTGRPGSLSGRRPLPADARWRIGL